MNLITSITHESISLKEIANQVLMLTNKYTSEAAVSIIKTVGLTISTLYGKVENVEFSNNEILKVIVFLQQKKGVAFSNNLNLNSIAKTVDFAVKMAHYTVPDLCSGIADMDLLEFHPVNLDLCHPIEFDVKSNSILACTAENVALQYDKRIICTEGGKFNSYITTKIFGNTRGILHEYSTSQHSLSCSVIARDYQSMEQNYAYTVNRVFNKLKSPDWVGEECARKVLQQLGSKKIRTMQSAVIFMKDIAVTLFQHLSDAIDGNNVYHKSTFLLHDLGKNIFPSWLSVTECPCVLQGIGSAPFDNEGVKVSNRMIVKNGILNTWLLDSYSARKMQLKSTGHSGGIYNWYINHQDITFTELVKNMHRGLIITNLMGQGVNIITGDYSRGVSGLWVENGEIQYPVNEVTISGNLREMFFRISAISNDIDINSNIHCGSVLIDSIQIAGI